MAEGIGCRVEPHADLWHLVVAPEHGEAAHAVLAAFDRENRRDRLVASATATAAPGEPDEPAGRGWVWMAVPGVLIAAYLLTGPRALGGPWFRAGSADAGRILAGDTWRAVTALTLHADLSHLVGNVVSGTLLCLAVTRVFGSGLGLLLVVLSGALGNLVNAALRGPPHSAVGASTAVLGAVGVLSGSAAVRTMRDQAAPRRAWLPIAAGLGLLAMLGAGERTDLGAHLFGFVAGALLGVVAAVAWRRAPGTGTQVVLGVGAAGLLAGAWALAVRAGAP